MMNGIGNLPYQEMKLTIEKGIEKLLQAADKRVHWIETVEERQWMFIPGIYEWKSENDEQQEPPNQHENDSPSVVYRLTLDSDNRFTYVWHQSKSGKKTVERRVEIQGEWVSPILSRDKLGQWTNKLEFISEKISFTRKSKYDKTTNSWKHILHSHTKDSDQDWISCQNDFPAINLVFHLENNTLRRHDPLLVRDLLNSTDKSYELAGLGKKTLNPLGNPLQVMTDKWLIDSSKHLQKIKGSEWNIKQFNPILLYDYKKPSHCQVDRGFSNFDNNPSI